MPAESVQHVALGQEVVEVSRSRRGPGRTGPPPAPQTGGAVGDAVQRVPDEVAFPLQRDAGEEIGQTPETAGRQHRDATGRIEAEEKHAGLAAVTHVGSHVALVERAHRRDPRQRRAAKAGHRERNEAHPRHAVEGVDLQRLRHQRTQCLRSQPPVGEQQRLPGHSDRGPAVRPHRLVRRLVHFGYYPPFTA